MALLKSGCMKFRASFLADTGIDPFCSCTIAGACMHVFRTSHLKENTIARGPPNGYRSMRNYSNTYVCKSKHYPVGYRQCLIGPNLRGLDVNSYDGLIKCTILPPRGLRIPLLPCHINDKLMFVLCRAYAKTKNYNVCGHTRYKLCLTGTWVSVELQKAVDIWYVII